MAKCERSLTGLALFLGVQALLFVCIGLASATAEVRFIHASARINNCDSNIAFGLQRYYSFSSCTKDTFNAYYYKSDSCKNGIGDDECSTCEEAGQASLFFMCLAFIVTVFTVLIQFLRLAQVYHAPAGMSALECIWPSLVNKTTTGILLETSALLLLLSFSIAAGSMLDAIKGSENIKSNNYDVELSAGFAVLLLAMIFTMTAGIIEFLKLPDPLPNEKERAHVEQSGDVAVNTETHGNHAKSEQIPVEDLEDFLADTKKGMDSQIA